MNVAFWNVGRQGTQNDYISALVAEYEIDLLVLAEYSEDLAALNSTLAAAGLSHIPQLLCKRIWIFSKIPRSSFQYVREHERYAILALDAPMLGPVILGLVHMRSKLHASPLDQTIDAMCFAEDLARTEAQFASKNTVLLGDFNMDPYDPGMTSAKSVHAIASLRDAKRMQLRTVQGRDYLFFYNPCWNLLGDLDLPPGTFYHTSPGYESLYWRLPDQVLIRPQLGDALDRGSLRIVTTIGGVDLLNLNGTPRDHLPLFFSIDLGVLPRSEARDVQSMA